MEKTRLHLTIFWKIILSILFLSGTNNIHSQKLHRVKDGCGIYYASMVDLHKQKEAELNFYNFRAGQTVASIGAGCCHWEAAYAAATDSVTFYLEDIDTTQFNKIQADFAWRYYDSLRGRPMTSGHEIIFGDERSTHLPENIFDKITIINGFHEFTLQTEMLADIKKKLKPDGILYIDEALPLRPGQLHWACNKPLLDNEEMIALLKQNGFTYVNGLDMNFRKKKPMRKIFAFRKTLS